MEITRLYSLEGIKIDGGGADDKAMAKIFPATSTGGAYFVLAKRTRAGRKPGPWNYQVFYAASDGSYVLAEATTYSSVGEAYSRARELAQRTSAGDLCPPGATSWPRRAPDFAKGDGVTYLVDGGAAIARVVTPVAVPGSLVWHYMIRITDRSSEGRTLIVMPDRIMARGRSSRPS